MTSIANGAAALVFASALLMGCASLQVNKSADVLFKEGEQYFQKGNYGDAIDRWKKVKESYQSPKLSMQAELNIADAYFLNKDYIEAATEYENFHKLHPTHLLSAFVLYRQALSYYYQIGTIDTDQTPVKNSLQLFESYLKLYPVGEELVEVRRKIYECRDKQLQYEIYVGQFYLKTDVYKAAISRFENALVLFPEQGRRDEVLYLLGKSYLKDGQKTKGREIFERLVKEFPLSPFLSDANKAIHSIAGI